MEGMNGHECLGPDAYGQLFTLHVAAVVRELMQAAGLKPYALAIPGKLSAETIRNILKGRHSPGLRTLGMLAWRLGTTVEVIVLEAAARMRR